MISKKIQNWNQVIFETFYSPESAGLPVYLDLDDDVFERLSAHPLLAGEATVDDLISTVKNSLRTDLKKSEVFIDFEQATHIWISDVLSKRNTTAPPPMLALLAVTVLAAEKMGSEGGRGKAYYVHLNALLEIEDKYTAESIEESYRKTIIYLWQALGTFLLEKGGYHGVPTAYSLSTTHVGAAVSQALVRDFDRKKLPNMFDYLRLGPGDSVTTDDMAGLFQAWLSHEDNGISRSLKNLWDRGAKEEISQVLCNELSKWDGTLSGNQRSMVDGALSSLLASKAKLVAHFKTSLGIRKFSSSFAINVSTQELESHIFSINGVTEREFRFSKRTNSLAECMDGFEFNPQSLLTSVLDISSSEGKNWRRVPKNIVMFTLDQDSGLWLEVDKAALGQQMCVLAKLDSEAWTKLPSFLELNARTGFSFDSKTKNIPDGWGLINHVEIIAVDLSSTVSQDLKCLIPVSGSQIVFSEGLRLPTTGSLRFWHRECAPNVSGISQSSKALRLDVSVADWSAYGKMRTVLSQSSASGFVELNLRNKDLADGNYKVGLYDGPTLLSERDLFLRSSETPDAAAVHNRQTIVHQFHGNSFDFLMNSSPMTDPASQQVSGLFANFEIETTQTFSGNFGALLGWEIDQVPEINASYLDLRALEQDSCAYTGRHRRELGLCSKITKYVLGVCQGCGDRSIELCKSWLAAPKDGPTRQSIKAVKAADLRAPKIQVETNSTVNWEIALDVISYCVAGTYSSLLTAFQTLEAGDFTSRRIAQELEILGFIEVARNNVGEETNWSLSAPQAVLRGSQIDLIGYWPRALIKQLSDRSLLEPADNGRLTFATLGVANRSTLAEIANSIEDFWYLESSPEALVLGLPNLSEVVIDARREALPAMSGLEQFNFEIGKWQESETGFPKPGAFKLQGKIGTRYYCASAEDLKNGKAIPGSATMVKWLGANIEGSSCLAYRENRALLVTPLGMQLFGLYARAAAAFSGKNASLVQSKTTGKRFNNYTDVPAEAASLLASKCTS